MNISAPDTLKTVDRTPGGLGSLPAGDGATTTNAQASALRPGETFAALMNRQRIVSSDAAKTSESSLKEGETAQDYLNRVQVAGTTAAADETTPCACETAKDFLNRRQTLKELNNAATPANEASNTAPAATTSTITRNPVETDAEYLNRQKTLDQTDAAAKRQQMAEKAAGDLAANALILPMLKQLRRSPWGQNTVYSGGIGEKTFGPEFDMQIADRIAHSPRLGVTTALASRLMQRGQPTTTDSRKLDVHG